MTAPDRLAPYRDLYLRTLTDDVIPFWARHAPDREYGAFFSCLDRDGSVYDTEKFMWLQWRIVWMFAELAVKLERRPEWIELAENGFRFLLRHGRDEQGRYYFSLARNGRPAMAPYSVFSECFAVMGAAALFRATGDPEARAEAIRAFDAYRLRESRPKGEWTKEMDGRPAFQSLGFYMMKANLLMTLREGLNDVSRDAELAATVEKVLATFWHPERRIVFENVGLDGRFDLDSMTGRHLNPGHAVEAMWFLLHAARVLNRPDWVPRIADIILAEFDFAWDPEHGGLFYFMDALGKPHVELQWDMKLWWVHNEALIAAALAYRMTGRTVFADWFDKLHDWTWSRYPDPAYGEWFGYLNRQGKPTHLMKGGKWKGFFHLPRMLLVCRDLLAAT
ncbi:MAG: AGE family epimerase/isomerase [Lentisphaerae bacterium]|nr:AGE family epimerase/isomerase [Lentisphaerota bacterium]